MKIAKIVLFFVGLFAFSFSSNVNAYSDNCNTYFPISVGMEWTMKNMDKKGKETSRSTMKVLEALPAEGGLIYKMQGILSVDGKKEEEQITNFEYQCTNNVLKFSMDQFLPESYSTMEGIEIDIDTEGMEVPNELDAGEKLKDASVHITGMMNGMKVMDMTVNITDRIVEKFEDITTEAGTFNCAKITSKTTMRFGFINSSTSSNQWISSKVGIVKTEEFDKKGKLESVSELVEFKK
ncbi:MAG: hypothetical protein R3279_07665 [Putridiphycobacter sp.]|nr:hypothetical protein [Putridiphycobacter sp.]